MSVLQNSELIDILQVYLHNPWLTYGVGIHRLREAGLGTDLLDLLDEKPFNLREVRKFCVDLFLGKDELSLRNPNVDLDGFVEDLQNIVKKEKLVWNPLKNRLTPWIDVEKLRLMTNRNESKNKPKIPLRRATTTAEPSERPKVSSLRRDHTMSGNTSSERKPNSRGNRRFASSVQTPGVGFKEPPTSNGHESPNRKPNRHRSTFSAFNASFAGGDFQNAAGTYGNYGRSASSDDVMAAALKQSSTSGPKDLEDAIKQWSRKAPDYTKLKPMADILVGVPELFPPNNPFVETHEHFFKWKEFSADAFIGESGDELKALLKRASRKSKLFMHPDKIPNDCTPSQETLFKSMWEILQESESKTFE